MVLVDNSWLHFWLPVGSCPRTPYPSWFYSSIYPYIHQSTIPFMRQSIYLSIHPFNQLINSSIHPFIKHPSIHLSFSCGQSRTHPDTHVLSIQDLKDACSGEGCIPEGGSIHQSTHHSIHATIHLSIHSINWSIHLSIHSSIIPPSIYHSLADDQELTLIPMFFPSSVWRMRAW